MIAKFIDLLRRCYRLARPYGVGRLLIVVSSTLANGLLQVIGVTSVLPFFALASDPGGLRQSRLGSKLLGHLPPMTDAQLLIWSGILAVLMLFAANGMTLFSEVTRTRYVHEFGHWLRRRLLEQVTARPYSYFLQRNSASIMQKIVPDVMTYCQNVFLPLTDALSRLVTIGLLFAAMFAVQPVITSGASAVLGIYYLMVFAWLRPKARRIGEGLKRHNQGQLMAAQQFLGGIKPVLVHEKKSFFMGRIIGHSERLAPLFSRVAMLGNLPRYLLEPLAFGGLVLVVVVLAAEGKPFANILPTLAVLALGAYRIMPSVQLCYSQFVLVMSYRYTLNEVESEIADWEVFRTGRTKREELQVVNSSITFQHEIRLENITFGYLGAPRAVLHGINLTIPCRSTIGIQGATGVGKSTLVDVILGLHQLQAGRLLVDGQEITPERMPAWRRSIGYVPQEIFLLDDTLTANIAFGIPPEDVNMSQVRMAAEAAQILAFVENELPNGFATNVGERGARLSGGQRQRIGLARALYHQPEVLILDEATSALDLATEAAVVHTINQLHGRLTIIVIAHRATAFDGCNGMVRVTRNDAGVTELTFIQPTAPILNDAVH